MKRYVEILLFKSFYYYDINKLYLENPYIIDQQEINSILLNIFLRKML